MVTNGGTHVVGDLGALEGGVRGLLANYRDEGFGHAVFEVRSARDVSAGLRSVELRWRLFEKKGGLLWEFDVSYVLRLREAGYRIAVVVNPAGR
jgi:hypothetical protein